MTVDWFGSKTTTMDNNELVNGVSDGGERLALTAADAASRRRLPCS
jgi:hypothetical protein